MPAIIAIARAILDDPATTERELRRVGMMALSGLIGVLCDELPFRYVRARQILVDAHSDDETLREVCRALFDIVELADWPKESEWVVQAALEPVCRLRAC